MQFYDGGAFADCPYIQFPHGMGKERAPATVVSAAAAAAAATTVARTSSYLTSSRNNTSAVRSAPSASSLLSCGVALATRPASPPLPSHATQKRSVETAEEATVRTAKGIQNSLQAAQHTTGAFDGRTLALQRRQRAAMTQPNAANKALMIVVGDGEGATGARECDPGPVVRSPTKEKKSIFTDALLLRGGGGSGGSSNSATQGGTNSSGGASQFSAVTAVGDANPSGNASAAASSRKVVVPFCVSSWQNRKKLIVPVEQRLAQQHDGRLSTDGEMGDAVIDLAIAMQQASKEVAAEMAAKERAQAEEEERRQAALEAAEAEKARQLLERKAAELAANAQRRETRELRLERIRLERELREQEKLAKQEQRLRERAAARLNITVEDLEADEQLLKTVEEASANIGVSSSSAGPTTRGADGLTNPVKFEQQQSSSSPSGLTAVEEDEGEETVGGRRKPPVRGGIFASAIISNEGIQREMEALAAVEAQQQQQSTKAPSHDGIRLRRDDENSADEDEADGEFQLHHFVKKKQRL